MRGEKKELNQHSVNLFPKHPIQTLHMDYRLTVMRGRVCPCCYDELSHTASSLGTITEKRLWFNLLFFKTQLFIFLNDGNKAFLRAC